MLFALVFDSVSGGEWIVLLAVVLIVSGPKNLPSMARRIGKAVSAWRRTADSFWRAIMSLDEPVEEPPEIPVDDSAHAAPPQPPPFSETQEPEQ